MTALEAELWGDLDAIDTRLFSTSGRRTQLANEERRALKRMRAAKAHELVSLLAAPLVRDSMQKEKWFPFRD